jgi:F-type H+-transporting ATPase subunit gamma
MASAREIRRRIRSVKNIAQVTRALEAVSASKVRRAQQAVTSSRPYSQKAFEILQHLSTQPGPKNRLHPLLEARPEVRAIGLVLITADRGLAGGYNTNVVRAGLDYARSAGAPIRWITIGRKGRDLIIRRGGRVVAEFTGLSANPSINEITPIARAIMDDFLRGEVDQVMLVYTEFVSLISQRPRVRQLLPLTMAGMAESAGATASANGSGPRTEYIYEPSAIGLLNAILPRFTETQVYQAILEALASEHSARMVAMRNATDNAKALVQDLTLTYNKARQLSITSDLLDIAGGAEALAQAQRGAHAHTEGVHGPDGRDPGWAAREAIVDLSPEAHFAPK